MMPYGSNCSDYACLRCGSIPRYASSTTRQLRLTRRISSRAVLESCDNNTCVSVVTFLDGNSTDMHNNEMSTATRFLDIKHLITENDAAHFNLMRTPLSESSCFNFI